MDKTIFTLRYNLNLIIGGLLGLIFFGAVFGLKILDPTYIDWQFKIGGDSVLGVVGWQFFRFEDWHFPLIGYISNYVAPLGSSIYVNGTPLLAIPFKIFRHFLPINFQFYGAWILSCYILQGVFASLLIQEFNKNTFFNAVGSLFFISAPIMLWRATGHFCLMPHWVILYAFWLNINSSTKKRFLQWLVLVSIAVLIFAYMYAMVVCLFFADCLRQVVIDKTLSRKKCILQLLAVLVISIFLVWITGGFQPGFSGLSIGGFGIYSMNLSALYNPQGWSKYLPDVILANAGQLEGYNYLGFGMLLLLAFSITTGLKGIGKIKDILKKHWPLLLILFGFAVYSLSDTITFGNTVLCHVALYKLLKPITSAFRCSGRFFWPTYYALFFVSLWSVNRYVSSKYFAKYIILVLVLLLQISDIFGALGYFKKLYTSNYIWVSDLQSDAWKALAGKYKKVIFMPNESYPPYYYEFALLAASNNMSISNGYSARVNQAKLSSASDIFYRNFNGGKLDKDAMYIITDLNILKQPGSEVYSNYCVRDIDGYFLVTKRAGNVGNAPCISFEKMRGMPLYYRISSNLYCFRVLSKFVFDFNKVYFYVKGGQLTKVLANREGKNLKLNFCNNKSVADMMLQSSDVTANEYMGWFYLESNQKCVVNLPDGYYSVMDEPILNSKNKISFSDSLFFINGWSDQEVGYRWSDGKMANIVFIPNRYVKHKDELLVSYRAVFGKQKVIVKLNGKNIYDNKLEGEGKIRIKFDKATLRGDRINTLSFYFPLATSPGNGDTRVLALALKSLQLDGDYVAEDELKLNTDHNILFSDSNFFISGWSSPEKEFRWSEGKTSTIAFLPSKDVKYTGKLLLDYAATMGDQKVGIKLNGKDVYSGKLRGSSVLQVRFNRNLLKLNKKNILTFSFLGARKPGGEDKRILALAFKSLQIK